MELEEIINNKEWEKLISNFNPKSIAEKLPFLTAVKLAHSLLYNEKWDENIQEFAIKILEEIMIVHSKEWNSSWQYDAFLGLAYDITLKYDERYEAFKRALEKATPPPAQLLIAMARCCDCPGKPPISYEKAIEYLNIALKDYQYVDGVGLMRKIYWFKDDIANEQYWARVLDKVKNYNKDSPSLDINFCKMPEQLLTERKNHQE